MGMTDPIADLLTRIRNATAVRHDKVFVPASNLKLRIVNLLLQEGFVRNFKVIKDGQQDRICVYLKYTHENTPVITHLGARLQAWASCVCEGEEYPDRAKRPGRSDSLNLSRCHDRSAGSCPTPWW